MAFVIVEGARHAKEPGSEFEEGGVFGTEIDPGTRSCLACSLLIAQSRECQGPEVVGYPKHLQQAILLTSAPANHLSPPPIYPFAGIHSFLSLTQPAPFVASS
jgi:hypothetical protein